jgi:hypothetical protein
MGSVDAVVALGRRRHGSRRAPHRQGAWDALMDRAADPAIVSGIAAIARDWPGVRGFHDLKTRTAGSRIFVNLHIELDGDQSLRDAHDIGASLRREILGPTRSRCHHPQGRPPARRKRVDCLTFPRGRRDYTAYNSRMPCTARRLYRRESRGDRRTDLITATQELVAEGGPEAATVRAIANVPG